MTRESLRVHSHKRRSTIIAHNAGCRAADDKAQAANGAGETAQCGVVQRAA